MKIEKHVIKKYKLKLTEQEMGDLIMIIDLYCGIYKAGTIDDDFIDNTIQRANRIGDITATNLIKEFKLWENKSI